MPKLLAAGNELFKPDREEPPRRRDCLSPAMIAVEFLRPTTAPRAFLKWLPAPRAQWLSSLFRIRAKEPGHKEAALTEVRTLREETEQTTLLEQAASSGSWCSGGAIALTVLSLAAAGAAGAALYRRENRDTGRVVPFTPSDHEPAVYAALADLRPVVMPPAGLMPLLNATRDAVMTRFPGIRAEAVTELMLAPLIGMLADSVPGHAADVTQQQLSMLTGILFSTLTTPENLLLYRAEKTPFDTVDIRNRFLAYAGHPYIRLGSEAFLLRMMPDRTPYIVDNDGRCRFIRYNQVRQGWEYVREVNNLGYSADSRAHAEKNRVSLTALPAGTRFLFDTDKDRVTISSPDRPARTGVFVDGNFISIILPPPGAAVDKNRPQTQKQTACHPVAESRIVSRSKYGWYFMLPSARMDEALKYLLENTDRCVSTVPELPLDRYFDANGLRTDNRGLKFLVKDDKHYHVDYLYDPDSRKVILTLTDFPRSWLEYRQGVTLLKRAEDAVSALDTVKIKAALSTDAYFMEHEAVYYLQLYGFLSSAKPVSAQGFPGLSRGHDNSLVLTVNEDQYAVREFSGDQIRVKNADSPYRRDEDIILFPAGDTLLRARNRTVNTSYTRLPFSYPDSSATRPVVVESELHQLLQKHISHHDTLAPGTNLVARKKFAQTVLWTDTRSKRDYFYYNGQYFPAVLLDADHPANPAGTDCLSVYRKGDFYGHGLLTTLVVTAKPARTEIKTLAAHLGEKTGTGKDTAALFTEKFPWRHTPNIAAADETASITAALEKRHVAPALGRVVKKSVPADIAAQHRLAVKQLYPARISPSQVIFRRLTDDSPAQNNDERVWQYRVKNTVDYLKETVLPTLGSALNYSSPLWPTLKPYLSEATGITSDEFQSELAVPWRRRLNKIRSQLNAENIYLAGVRNIHLSRDEKLRAPLLFIPPGSSTLYISTHKLPPGERAQMVLTSAMMQQIARATGVAADMFSTGGSLPVREALEVMTARLMQRKLSRQQLGNLQRVSRQFMDNNPPYNGLKGTPLRPETAAFLARFDPAYRAHLMLNSDRLLTLVSLDCWYRLAAGRRDDIWVAGWRDLRTANETGHAKSDDTLPHMHIHIPSHEQSKIYKNRPPLAPVRGSAKDAADDRTRPGSDTGGETEYEDLTDTDSVLSQETLTSDITDTDSVLSQETLTSDITDTDSVLSQETEFEELTDTDSVSSQQTLSSDITDTDTGSLDLPSPLFPPVPPVLPPIPPVHPVMPPPVPNSLPAEIVASAALGVGGIYLGVAAPRPPVVTPPADNSTVTNTPAAIPPEKHKQFLIRPEDQAKNRRQPFARDSHDDLYVPDEMTGSDVGREERVFVPGHGKVTSITIPELECLGEKEVTFPQVMRWAGETLQLPVAKNAEAWQEIYHIDTLGGDCPMPEAVDKLRNMTVPIDVAINTAMSFSKRFKAVAALQNVVGPALVLGADTMEGKNITRETRQGWINLLQQSIGYARVDMATLNVNDLSSAAKKGVPNKADTAFKKRFTASGGKVYVNVDGKEYPLDTAYDETPMVQNDEGRPRIISYNHLKQKWEFSHAPGNNIKTDAQKNQDIYRIPTTKLAKQSSTTVDNDDIYTIKFDDGDEITGAYVGMDFIPAQKFHIGEDIVAYTTNSAKSDGRSRLLIKDDYGWTFERKSVEIDEYLKILLEQKDAGDDFSFPSFGPIQSDGLSYDNYGNAWLKYDYTYYNIDKKNPGSAPGEVTLPDYDDATIKWVNNRFILLRHEDTLFAAKISLVQDKIKAFYIEDGILEYLYSYGREINHALPERIGPGIYSDYAHANTVFAVDGSYFTVTDYTANEMQLTSFAGKEKLKFWFDNDTWLRVRREPEEPAFDYAELASCRRRRAPGGSGACRGVLVETELGNHLDRQIQAEMASNHVPPVDRLRLVRPNDIPYLYIDIDSNHYYFKYGDKYFNAEIVEANNKEENPTAFPLIKLTGRSDFYHFEKKIATIVMQHVTDEIKMTDLPTYISEKLHISKEEAILYVKKRPYNSLPYIKDLEELTDILYLSDDLYVSQPPDFIVTHGKQLNRGESRLAAIKALFPEHIVESRSYSVMIYDSKEAAHIYTGYVKEGIETVNRKVEYLREVIIPRVLESLNPENHNHPIVEDYLIEVLKKDTPNFLSDVEDSLTSRLRIVQDDLNRRRVKLMSVIYLRDNSVAEYAKENARLIYTHPNDPYNMYINLDMTDIGNNAQEIAIDELTGAMLAASLRSTKATSISCGLPRDDGIFININDAYRHIQNKIRLARGNEQINSRLRETILDYIRKSPHYLNYQDKLADISMDWKTFNYLLHNDAGIRAQIMLNSDDFLTLVTQDLHYLTSTSEQDMTILHPWVTRYGERRGILNFPVDAIERSDLIIYSEDDTPSLTAANIINEGIESVRGLKGIYRTQNKKMYLKNKDAFYAAEFIGKSGRLVVVGEPDDIRQVYYYEPLSGNIRPVREKYERLNVLRYCKEADLYESISPGFDFTEVLKFDEIQGILVPIGATRLAHLPGKVTRIEYPSFNVYHPQGASHDIFIMGHGRSFKEKSNLPENVYVTYYTLDGQALLPYRGNADDFISGKIIPTDVLNPGQEVENYAITSFADAEINHYHLARRYNKNIVQLFSSSARSEDLIAAASKLYPTGDVDIHYYTCRMAEESSTLSPSGELYASDIWDLARDAPTAEGSNRWIFDQQVEGRTIKADRSLRSFLPLSEVTSYLYFDTVEKFIKQALDHYFRTHAYDIFHGLDVSPNANRLPPGYITKTRLQLLANIDKARSSISMAEKKLNTRAYEKPVRDYLSYAFDTQNEKILNEIIGRLELQIKRVGDFLRESAESNFVNFAIASTKHTVDARIPGRFHSAIPDKKHLATLPSAFVMPGDAYRRVYIVNDCYIPLPSHGGTVDYKEMRQEHMILHEASHIVGNTVDISYVRFSENDFVNKEFNVADSRRGLQEIDKLLGSGNIKDNALWRDFMPLVKKYYNLDKPLDDAAVRKMITNDPMLKANLITTNADSFAIFVKHIANLELDGRRKREVNEPTAAIDYKHIALFFSLTKDHYIHNVE